MILQAERIYQLYELPLHCALAYLKVHVVAGASFGISVPIARWRGGLFS